MLMLGSSMLALLGPSGCTSEATPPVYPVEGSAFYRGQPATDARIYLHPVDSTHAPSTRPNGVVDSSGMFRISTYREFDGAPPGSYRLSIIWRSESVREDGENAGPDRLGSRYFDAKKNPWTVTVGPGTNHIDALELK
ncbi:MAG: hypothetical protein U0794_06995 [Isosphaeraceae bacterium]